MLDQLRFFKGLDPVANAFAGTVRSDVVNVAQHHKIIWLVYKGVGTTGTTTITVSAADDNSPTNETAVAFRYQRYNNSDVPGTLTSVASTGFTTTAGSSDLYAIEVDCKALASAGFKYCNLKLVESAASAVVGCIIGILCMPRFTPSTENITS